MEYFDLVNPWKGRGFTVTTIKTDEGYIALPKRLGFIVSVGALLAAGMYISDVRNQIGSLQTQQIESRLRGDQIRIQIAELQRDRSNLSERLTRLEEQSRASLEILRGLRDDVQELRKRP